MRSAMAAPGPGDSALQFLVMRTMARAAAIADADAAQRITPQYAIFTFVSTLFQSFEGPLVRFLERQSPPDLFIRIVQYT